MRSPAILRVRLSNGGAYLAATVMVFAAAGCGGAGSSGAEPVTIEGDEYAFVTPADVEGGVVAMRFVNTGEQLHEFALGRISGDQSLDELVEALSANGDVSGLEDVGGVPLLSPGEEITLTRALEPGRYALLCFFPSPDGTPHAQLGMKGEFEIAGESGTDLPTPDAVITATKDGFTVPDIEAGTQTIELRNDSGGEPSWYLAVPTAGATTQDFEEWIEGGQKGDSPISFRGAMQSFPSGQSVFATLEFEEGVNYRLEDDPDGLAGVTFTPQ